MALRKTYAATYEAGNIVTEQRDVDMHPFEEAETQARWKHAEEMAKIPKKPTQVEEHEWLIEHGPDYIKQKRAEWQKLHDDAQPAIQEAEKKWRELESVWNDHAIKAHANGFDPDTHPDARSLIIPQEQK